MTTTTAEATVLARYARATETITAEHHPSDHGMKYAVLIVGGKQHGIEIHCVTELSALWLFGTVVLYRELDIDHPFLAAV